MRNKKGQLTLGATNEVVAFLVGLSDEGLREVLCEVFKAKRPNPEEDAFNQNSFFLGTASLMRDAAEPEPSPRANIFAVAYIDRELYSTGLGPDWGFCQFGSCTNCGVAVRSNYKEGICPVCSARVSMS